MNPHIYPRIKYIGLKKGSYNIGIKFYDMDGLRSGKNSPDGYSYFNSVSIQEGIDISDNISGYGDETKGHWAAGDYRIEIWYNGKKMAEKSFKIY